MVCSCEIRFIQFCLKGKSTNLNRSKNELIPSILSGHRPLCSYFLFLDVSNCYTNTNRRVKRQNTERIIIDIDALCSCFSTINCIPFVAKTRGKEKTAPDKNPLDNESFPKSRNIKPKTIKKLIKLTNTLLVFVIDIFTE